MYKKLLTATIILLLCSVMAFTQQYNFEQKAYIDLRDGYIAKLAVRDDGQKVIIVDFPAEILKQPDTLERGTASALIRLFGIEEFVDCKAEVEGEKDKATLVITTKLRQLKIRPLVDNYIDRNVVGIEITVLSLPVVATPA